MCQWFADELISWSNQESVDQFVVKFGVRMWSQPRGWRQLCANPRQSYNVYNQFPSPHAPTPYPHLQPSFLMRSCIKTSKIVKNVRLPKVQKYSTLPNTTCCGQFFSFRWKVHLCRFPVHCWLPIVQPSIQNNFTLFLFLFLPYLQFLSRVLKLITAIYIIYVNF